MLELRQKQHQLVLMYLSKMAKKAVVINDFIDSVPKEEEEVVEEVIDNFIDSVVKE